MSAAVDSAVEKGNPSNGKYSIGKKSGTRQKVRTKSAMTAITAVSYTTNVSYVKHCQSTSHCSLYLLIMFTRMSSLYSVTLFLEEVVPIERLFFFPSISFYLP
jgi:hypothetical protein